MGGGMGQHETAITGAQVHRRRRVRRGDIGQLADVHLGEVASGQETHGPMIAADLQSLTTARNAR
jgi:hypothetical protein